MVSEVLFAPSAASGLGWCEGVEGPQLCGYPVLLDLPQELLAATC